MEEITNEMKNLDKKSYCQFLWQVILLFVCLLYYIFSKARCSSAKRRGYKIYLDGFYKKFSAIITYFVITVYIVQHYAKIE